MQGRTGRQMHKAQAQQGPCAHAMPAPWQAPPRPHMHKQAHTHPTARLLTIAVGAWRVAGTAGNVRGGGEGRGEGVDVSSNRATTGFDAYSSKAQKQRGPTNERRCTQDGPTW